MDPKKLADAARPENLGGYLAGLPKPMHAGHGMGGVIETVRQDDHNGHHIVIRTTYRIEVDGKTLPVPLGLDNDGHLHCHSLPNYQFLSAVDLVKKLIDSFPADFKGPAGGSDTGGHMHDMPEGGR